MALLLAETTWQKSLFLRDDFSDCEIIVNTSHSSQRFPCHRAILSSASEVFAKMFRCDCEETSTGKVVINDISPSDMLSVLKYIYDGCIYIEDWRMACGILKVAHKYNMRNLWQECENFLSRSLTLDNVCKILEFSILYDLTELKCQCLVLCSKACFAIVRRKSFLELNLDAMKQIFLVEDLNIENEVMAFKAAWERATLECCKKKIKVTDENIANEMKIFFECIGFEFMTVDEINSLPSAVRLLPEFQSRVTSNNKDVKTAMADVLDMYQSDQNSGEGAPRKKREMHFPLGLQNHLTKFRMFLSPSCTSSTGSLLLKFSFSSYVYLNDVTVVCYKDCSPKSMPSKNEGPSNQSGFMFSFGGNCASPSPLFGFYRPQQLFLNISSRNRTMEVPCSKIENSFVCQKKSSTDSLGSQCCTKVSKEVYKMKFEATRLLLLEADVEYVLEVCKPTDSSKYVLTWPAVLPKFTVPGKVQLKLHSKEYYGLSKLTVINAS